MAKVLKVNVIDLIPGSNKPSDKNDLEKILAEKESEIIKLQKKIIELLEGKSKNK